MRAGKFQSTDDANDTDFEPGLAVHPVSCAIEALHRAGYSNLNCVSPDSAKHQRCSIRLRDYDYGAAGAYFVTLCAHRRECLFGEIADGGMRLSEVGMIVGSCWQAIPDHFSHVNLDAWVIMPNHLHGIIIVAENVSDQNSDGVGARHCLAPTDAPISPKPGSLGVVVGSFKSAAAKRINTLRQTRGAAVWQRNYHERIVRNERELDAIREYIMLNPARWDQDENYPSG